MITEQHEERKSEQNIGHDKLLINENSSSDSSSKDSTALITEEIDSGLKKESENDSTVLQRPHNILDPFVINSDVKEEIIDIVQTIAKAVFCIIDNISDQLANRSSNTLGMRVKDSLILKAQQTHRKEIPFDELKTSLACRLIVDDDLQIGFLPRIESLPLSSDCENLSTKQKKSVSLAEEVKVFDRVENEFLTENEVGFLTDSVDITQNDRIMNPQRSSETDDKMYDLNEQKSSSFLVESESFCLNKYNTVGDLRKSESHTSSKVLKKFCNSGEDRRILSNTNFISVENERTQMSDMVVGVRNSSIATSASGNQIIVRLVEPTPRHSMSKTNKSSVFENEKSKEETSEDLTKRNPHELKDQFENVVMTKRSKTVNEDSGESAVYAKEQIDPRESSASIEKQSSDAIDVLNAEEVEQKESSEKDPRSKRSPENTKSSKTEILDTADTIVSKYSNEEKQRTTQIKKLIGKTTWDESKGEDQAQEYSQSTQSLKNSKQESLATLAWVGMDHSASAKLDPGQPCLESNNEDRIPEKGTLNANFSAEISLNDENTFTCEAEFNSKRSPDVADQTINDSEISEEKERPESLSKNECVAKDGEPVNENVKLFEKTFVAANVESGNLLKPPIASLVQKHPNKNKHAKDITVIQDTNSDDIVNIMQKNQEEGIINEQSNHDSQSSTSNTEDHPESKSNTTIAVDQKRSTERNISSANKRPNSSSDGEGVEQEIVTISTERKSPLFSRIMRSKNRVGNNVASGETAVDEDTGIGRKLSETRDQYLAGFQHLSIRGNSEIDLEDVVGILLTREESDTDKVGRKDSRTLPKIESQELVELTLIDENLRKEFTFDAQTSSPRNSSSPKKTTLKVSLKAAKLSKKSSRTDSSANQESTNDLSLEKTSSKVSRKASKLSVKLSRADISELIISGPDNLRLAAETLLVYSTNGNVTNPAESLHVADTSATENELELPKNLKTRKKSESSLKKLQTQVFPAAIDNILRLDLIRTTQRIVDATVSQQQNQDDENDKVEKKTSHSFGRKSSSKLKCDEEEVSGRGSGGNDAEDSAKEQHRRKNSMLNVVSKFSIERDGGIRDNLQPENYRDDKSFKSFLNSETSKPRNKSEGALIESANSNFEQSHHILEASVSTKKRNRFMEGLKRSLQSIRNRSKRSVEKSETKLKVSSESQVDMDEEVASGSSTEFKNGNDIEKLTRSPQLMDTNFSQSSAMIEEDFSIGGTQRSMSHDIIRQDKEKQSLLSNIKSIFKSSNRSKPRKRSIASIGDPEDRDVINKSLDSLRTNPLGESASEIEVDKEQSSHFIRKSVEVPTIQSMKSLQDNRKRSKNRQRAGHKLLDDEDTPFVTEKLVTKSYEATTLSDFIRRRNEEKTEDVEVDGESHCSEESIAESNLQALLTDEEEVEEQTAEISKRRKKSKRKENPEGNTRRFAISLSRIFSNSSRKRNAVKESCRATANSQTSPEDHFEITRIPLSSSDHSDTQGIDFKLTKQRSDAIEDNNEEIIAIKSLNSTCDLDNQTATRKSTEKRSSRIRELKCTTNISNDQLLCPSQSGTFIYSAPVVVNQISSENELAKKNSLNNVQEVRNPVEKVYVAKGTIVSYAPMVESAKYIPADELDDRLNEDDQSENRQKRSSGKSFATIRKLFSRASIKGGQDHATVEDHSVDHADHETKKGSKKSGKSSIIKHRKDREHSVGQLYEEPEREYVISAKISPAKSMKDDEDENKERKTNYHEITKQLSKTKVNNAECPVVHGEDLHVDTVAISRTESANIQCRKNDTDDREYGSKQVVTKSDEVDIAGNKIKPNHGGLKPTDIVVDEIVISPVSQTDFNNQIDVEQKSNQRSNRIKKGSLLSMAKIYMKGHTEIEREEMEGSKQLAGEKNHDENSVTLSIEDLKTTSKEQGVAKTESILSRGLKRLFKKRSSVVDPVASNNCAKDPADDLSQLNVQTLPSPSINDTTDLTMAVESPELRKSESRRTSDGTQFAVYNAKSEMKFPTNCDDGRQSLEDKKIRDCLDDIDTSQSKSTVSLLTSIAKKSVETLSKAESQYYDKNSSIKYESTNKNTEIKLSAALANSGVHIAISFPKQNNPESETRVNQDGNVAQNQSRSKIGSKDFRLNPSFASKRSTVVMMASPMQPRIEPQAEVSHHSNHQRDESPSSPTAFYYLLGPSLDEALVDVRVVFQNLIDKITGRGR